jgi:hypothetical protein
MYRAGTSTIPMPRTRFIPLRQKNSFQMADGIGYSRIDKAEQINRMYPAGRVQKYESNITYSANKRGRYLEYLFAPNSLKVEPYSNIVLRQLNED